MTPRQRRCVIEATIAPLARYRRGYARSKFGPFYRIETLRPLLQSGALRRLPRPFGRPARVTAIAIQEPST